MFPCACATESMSRLKWQPSHEQANDVHRFPDAADRAHDTNHDAVNKKHHWGGVCGSCFSAVSVPRWLSCACESLNGTGRILWRKRSTCSFAASKSGSLASCRASSSAKPFQHTTMAKRYACSYAHSLQAFRRHLPEPVDRLDHMSWDTR